MERTFIKKIKSIKANPAVTIYMKTNRTFPENSKDIINLKNLIVETEKRLKKEYNEDVAKQIIKKLKDFASGIDHNYNLDSMIIFVSSDFIEFVRLPVKVKNNVIIDNKFATKVLIRALLQSENYYVMCISRKIIRLIEAVNDTAVNEINDGTFPIQNESYVDTDDIRKAWGNIYDNYAKEFFSKADKQFTKYYKINPRPLVLAGDIRNISYYKEITRNKNNVIGQIEGNYDNTKDHEIAKRAYETVIKPYSNQVQEKFLEEINVALKENKLLVDINDIYNAARDGKGFKLFVEKNYVQPVKIENNRILLKDNPTGSDVIDDVVNEIIDLVNKSKGNVMFMNPNQLKEFNKIVLISRY